MKRGQIARIGAALALVACAHTPGASGGATGGGSGSTAGGASATVTARTLRKGETQEVDLSAGQTHEWGIDLAAGEAVHLTLHATSVGEPPCTNWTWGFFNVAGGSLRENVMGPNNAEGGAWNSVIDGTAEASVVEGPVAGRYRIRVSADPVACPALHYTLRAN